MTSCESSVCLAAAVIDEIAADLPPDATAFLYGSGARPDHPLPRDLDIAVLCRDVAPAYHVVPRSSLVANVHIVPDAAVAADIEHDEYGWALLTKFLGKLEVLRGDRVLVERLRARCFLRLLGQWAATNGVVRIEGSRSARDAVVEVLSAWNPQFEVYLRTGKASPDDYEQFFRDTSAFPEWARGPNGALVSFISRPPEYRAADLRLVLVRYWGHYLLYKRNRSDYLTSFVSSALHAKLGLTDASS